MENKITATHAEHIATAYRAIMAICAEFRSCDGCPLNNPEGGCLGNGIVQANYKMKKGEN